MEVTPAQLPDAFYYGLGVMVFMSAGSLLTAFILIVKVAVWVGEYKQRMITVEKDNNAAHAKIRELEKKGEWNERPTD